ncbi:aminotransferase class III-fold pyridoxal phosphate-dependent enzyme [Hyalangium minutum]|uniref:Glutamate-1-semialdehyde aminotransferase n=1 Tax=Hyalangium minutum TaxID=394096 RepID=A0A085VYX6_9BACT|nr:aminotransferase class III-fold pyridoxal phosphate-dependent enzyme [Hyalangium minutum]KFE60639.1 Glutamate-1-semialdehyde aminotransferase [Hyalangium minutum]
MMESSLTPATLPPPPQRLQAVSAQIGQLFSTPFLQGVLGTLAQRQQKSLQMMGELRQHEISCLGFWPFVGIFLPLGIESAEGSRLLDVDGNEYLDFFMGFGTHSLHGHNPEPVTHFVQQMMRRSVGNAYSTPLHLEYVRLLKELVPHREKFAFLNSGSDATSAAVRISRAATGRQLVVRFEGSSNGQHDLTSYNGISAFFGYPFTPFPPKKGPEIPLRSYSRGVHRMGPEDLLILSYGEAASLDVIRQRKDEIACVIAESIPFLYPTEQGAVAFLRELSEVCRKAGVVFVVDEVHTGFRYGPSGVVGHYNVHADLVTYGKVMAALGIPLSAVAGRSDLIDVAGTAGGLTDVGTKTLLGTTHAGSHLAVAASYASLSLLREKGPAFYERTRKKAARLRAAVESIELPKGLKLKLHGHGEFTGYMMFMRDQPMETHRDYVTNMLPIATNVLAMLLRSKGIHSHSVPVTYLGDAHSEQDIDLLIAKTREAVEEMKRNDFPFLFPTLD